ncbi:hypothetical protein GCM10010911_64930 [Paenibacillus nasutitermitis]|uniref:Uncharacterized protein n=1 Tax=Paenibacillus nasutitermitis TaxID=1652958 RepID=A0A916ZHY0_9BACL|nr:hypothetical protein GCM10010911_64930 [Paenibacillus nasutitermitis]
MKITIALEHGGIAFDTIDPYSIRIGDSGKFDHLFVPLSLYGYVINLMMTKADRTVDRAKRTYLGQI